MWLREGLLWDDPSSEWQVQLGTTRRADADRRDGTIGCQVGALVYLRGSQFASSKGWQDLVSRGDDGGYYWECSLASSSVSYRNYGKLNGELQIMANKQVCNNFPMISATKNTPIRISKSFVVIMLKLCVMQIYDYQWLDPTFIYAERKCKHILLEFKLYYILL